MTTERKIVRWLLSHNIDYQFKISVGVDGDGVSVQLRDNADEYWCRGVFFHEGEYSECTSYIQGVWDCYKASQGTI